MLPVRCKRALLLLLVAWTLSAQTTARYTVSGTVVNSATNEPIRRALVGVAGSLVFTGVDGRFRAENVPEGQAMVAAQKPGFFDTPLSNVRLTVQAHINDVVLKLAPEARIEGKIVDDEGEPVGNVEVQALSRRVVNGKRQLQQEGSARTDERGRYRMDGLNAGTFVLRTPAAPVGGFEERIPLPPPTQVFPPRYFPNASSRGAAQNVELRPGAVQQADFTLKPVRAFHIAGTTSAAGGSFSIECENDEQDRVGTPQLDPKTGKFVVYAVPSGTWTLLFRDVNGEHRTYYARETVTVTSRDVDGLAVSLQRLANIAVNVVSPSAEITPQVGLELQAVDGSSSLGAMMFPGNFYGLPAVPPGIYRVFVPPFGGGCVESVTSGNLELSEEPLSVASGSQPQPISVTLRHDCASLQVTARSRSKNERVYVVLVSNLSFSHPIVSTIDAGETFNFGDLTPGDYTAYVLSNIEGVEYANPDAMSEFSGHQITLSPNQHGNLTLDVIETGEK